MSNPSSESREKERNGNEPDSSYKRSMAVRVSDLISELIPYETALKSPITYLMPKILFVFDEFRIGEDRQFAFLAVSRHRHVV